MHHGLALLYDINMELTPPKQQLGKYEKAVYDCAPSLELVIL